MKTLNVLFLLIFFATSSFAQQNSFADIGERISEEQAKNYIENFKKANTHEAYGITYGREMIEEILATENASGIVIFFAQNEKGNSNFVLQAVNDQRIAFGEYYDSGSPCPPVCNIIGGGVRNDDNTLDIAKIGGRIDTEKAQEILTANSSDLIYYAYGKTIFEKLLAIEGTEGIYFANGLNDEKEYHMVLASVNSKGEIIENSYANSGSACPPDCNIITGGGVSLTKND